MMERNPRQLRVEHVSKSFPSAATNGNVVLAVDDVSLNVNSSEIVSIVGPSGCGKSTLLRMAAGFEAPSGGAVYLGDSPIKGASFERGIVFQQPALFPWLNVLDNVAFGPKMRGVDRNQYLDEAASLIEAVNLTGFERHFPYQLSGGMKQRAQIARVLINRPEILLMDEPFGALDFQTRLSMQRLVVELCGKYRQSVLFITHDVDEAIFLSDRIFVMKARPGCIQAEYVVPFGPNRHYATVTRSKEAAEIKLQILSLLGYSEQNE